MMRTRHKKADRAARKASMVERRTVAGGACPAARRAPDGYAAWLGALKSAIGAARVRSSVAVNRELVLFYWRIGREIVKKQQTVDWGDSVVKRLAADLQAEFPNVRGFSLANLWRMRQFYVVYSSPEFLAQAAPEIRKAKGEFLAQVARESDFVTG